MGTLDQQGTPKDLGAGRLACSSWSSMRRLPYQATMTLPRQTLSLPALKTQQLHQNASSANMRAISC